MNHIISPLIIDVEASGFGCSSYPIEVGVALNDGKKFCSLIIPEPEWNHWDSEAEKVHHLSREMLATDGKSVHEVTERLNNLFYGLTLYSDGWVVDQPWLIKLFQAASKSMEFRVSPLEMILSEKQMVIWHKTKDDVIEEAKLTRHRASSDAWIIQETFKRTFKKANEKNS